MTASSIAIRDRWEALRAHTAARVALGRAGSALPTAALLAFEADQARARDAVHRALDVDALAAALAPFATTIRVRSAAADRATYLARPDLGRRLDDDSRERLVAARPPACDVVLVVADGLSAAGVQAHVPPLVAALLPRLEGLAIGPLVVVEQGRVAIGDDVGEALGARLVVVALGERPGLTSPDSVGLYLTFAPRVGRHDAERNCLSNVRPAGLPPAAAAIRLSWLVRAALERRLSGVALKDESAAPALVAAGGEAGPASGGAASDVR